LDLQRVEGLLHSRFGADRVNANVPLAPFTTFKVGGPADWMLDVRTVAELTDLVEICAGAKVGVTVLGGGSNILVGDRGVRGVVVKLRLTSIAMTSPDRVRAEAGATINGLVRWTVGRGLAGVEAWAGTPGTVGGAIFGNAHYGGRNLGDRLTSVQVATRDGRLVTVPREQMAFAYDASRLQTTGEIAIWGEFAVQPGSPEALRQTARASLAHRKRTQPLDTPSAGCIFQNPDPVIDVLPADVPPSAGALIDRAGLKGWRHGGAMISATHANFFLNDGRATARDIDELIGIARDAVRERFGVELRNEIVRLGEF
jgi:UDP-N-acetylmuramate dehydrogenase